MANPVVIDVEKRIVADEASQFISALIGVLAFCYGTGDNMVLFIVRIKDDVWLVLFV